MTNQQRITAARVVFTSNSALTALYVCTDGQCFVRSLDASGHARDLTGNPNDYFGYLKASNTIVDDIAAANTSDDVDTALASSTDAILISVANDRKAAITEAARVASVITYVGTATSVTDLNLLKHGESDSTVIAAINTKITALG